MQCLSSARGSFLSARSSWTASPLNCHSNTLHACLSVVSGLSSTEHLYRESISDVRCTSCLHIVRSLALANGAIYVYDIFIYLDIVNYAERFFLVHFRVCYQFCLVIFYCVLDTCFETDLRQEFFGIINSIRVEFAS